MTTQISSPCITTTDICNGSYGCGTDTEMAVLARVVPVWEKDEWSIGKAYGPLSVVKAPGTDTLYISKVPVPCGIELGDPKYWSVYNDNKVASEAKEIAEEARAEAAGAVSAADAASRAVVAEAEARENADSAITTELNAKIMQEQEARETADTTINEEVSRLSSNSDALSARVDELEQNGGSGIASLEERVTAVETVNTQQGTEIESMQAQLTTVNDDMDSLGEQLHGMAEQVGVNSGELDQLIVPGAEEGTWGKGPVMEQWLADSGGSIQTPVSLADGGTGADNQKDAANNLLVRDYANASMDGQDAWNHGNFVVGDNKKPTVSTDSYLLPPDGSNKFVIAQMTGNQEGSNALFGKPVLQLASNANGMLFSKFLPTGVATAGTASQQAWVQHPSKPEVDAQIEEVNSNLVTAHQNINANAETISQLIRFDPSANDYVQGPKMEEWTSGGSSGLKQNVEVLFNATKEDMGTSWKLTFNTYNANEIANHIKGNYIATALFSLTCTSENMDESVGNDMTLNLINGTFGGNTRITGNGLFYLHATNDHYWPAIYIPVTFYWEQNSVVIQFPKKLYASDNSLYTVTPASNILQIFTIGVPNA